MTPIRPADMAVLTETIAGAAARGGRLSLRGGGTKSRSSVGDTQVVDLTGLSGVIEHQPSELVLTAWAGTPLATVTTVLAAHGQMLAFDPPRHPPFGMPGVQTIGGVVATNLAGPRRLKWGAPRDHVLGFTGVSGRGEGFRAGGNVVKNVTGFDLCKLVAGSRGTLVALGQVTVKVMPAARASLTVTVEGLDDAAAIASLTTLLAGPADIAAAAHMSAATGSPMTSVRIEGFAASVDARAGRIVDHYRRLGRVTLVEGAAETEWWETVAAARPIERAPGAVWRIVVPASAAPGLVADTGGRALYDWGGNLVWLASDIAAADLHAVVARHDGHAALARGDDAAHRADRATRPAHPERAAIEARLRAAFDPHGVFAAHDGDR